MLLSDRSVGPQMDWAWSSNVSHLDLEVLQIFWKFAKSPGNCLTLFDCLSLMLPQT